MPPASAFRHLCPVPEHFGTEPSPPIRYRTGSGLCILFIQAQDLPDAGQSGIYKNCTKEENVHPAPLHCDGGEEYTLQAQNSAVVSCVSPALAFLHKDQSGTAGPGLIRNCPAMYFLYTVLMYTYVYVQYAIMCCTVIL